MAPELNPPGRGLIIGLIVSILAWTILALAAYGIYELAT